MKKRKRNKVAIFLAGIPDIFYKIGFLVGNIVIIFINKNRYFSQLHQINIFNLLSIIFEYLIEAGVLSIGITVVLGLILKIVDKIKAKRGA